MKTYIRVFGAICVGILTATFAHADTFLFSGDPYSELWDNLTPTGSPSAADTIAVRENNIANSTKDITPGSLSVNGGGILNIEGGDIVIGANVTTTFVVGQTSAGTVNMSGGNITFTETKGILTVGASGNGSLGTFNMTGGKLESNGAIVIANGAANSDASGKMIISNAEVSGGFQLGSTAAGVTGTAELVIHHNAIIRGKAGISGLNMRGNGIMRLVLGEGNTQASMFNTVDLSAGNNANIYANALLSLDVSDLAWIGADIGDSITLQLIKFKGVNGSGNSHKDNLLFDISGAIGSVDEISATSFEFQAANSHQYSADFAWTGTTLLAVTITDLGLIPEPSTYAAILGVGILAFVFYRRRKR